MPSVSSYGYSSMADSAAIQWNYITSNVSLSKSTTASNSNQIVVDVLKSQVDFCNCYGVADHFINGYYDWVSVGPNDKRDRTTITIDNKRMNGAFMNDTNRKHIFVHEFGHAVSLRDITAFPSIMISGSWQAQAVVQPLDKANLKLKWGEGDIEWGQEIIKPEEEDFEWGQEVIKWEN